MVKRIFILLFCSVGVAGCVGGPSEYFSQPGVPEARFHDDFDACVSAGVSAAEDVKTYEGNAPTSVAGALAVGLTKGIVENVQRRHAGSEAAEACMIKRGYAKLPMTDDQRQRFERLSPEDRKKADASLAAGSF